MAATSPFEELGSRLYEQFVRERGLRVEMEERWLKDLRQYKGVYDPEEVARMDKKQSQTFRRLTRIKVKSATSRLMDLMFPAGSQDNWTIEPTPRPSGMTPSPAILIGMATALGRMPTPEEVQLELQEQAKQAASMMQQEIKDQLAEAKYRRVMKNCIHSGNLFGTGLIKGPLVDRVFRNTWQLAEDGSWQMQTEPVLKPYIEFVPVWECYADSSAIDFQEARYVYQRPIMGMPRHQVLGLAKRPDFMGSEIRRYLLEQPDNDVSPTHWELELRRLGWNIAATNAKQRRYELLEFWGVLEAEDLAKLGLTPPDDVTEEYWGNVFLLGRRVVKAELQPIEGVQLPYFAYYWDKDETSIYGEGIPSVMRDDQKGLNAGVRAMQDNGAICAGPQFDVNVDLLHPDENPRDIYPRKVWLRSGVGAEANFPAVRAIDPPSHTQEYLSIIQDFTNSIHEATIPSFMHGEATSKGSVGRTVGGLSMLMSAAQITFKDQLFSLDDDVQQPLITALYHWNMQFNPKPEIKGDFDVLVKGTSSLVAREIRAQNLEQFATSTANPIDAPYIDRHALNVERAKVQELGDNIVVSREQALLNQVIQPMLDQGATQQQVPNESSQTGAPEQDQGMPGPLGGAPVPGVDQAA